MAKKVITRKDVSKPPSKSKKRMVRIGLPEVSERNKRVFIDMNKKEEVKPIATTGKVKTLREYFEEVDARRPVPKKTFNDSFKKTIPPWE